MSEFTAHELSLMEIMSERNKALMPLLNDGERHSMESYVTTDNLPQVEEMIGDDEHIEQLLFWDKGGKFDDPAWQALKPLREVDNILMDFLRRELAELRRQAVTIQRRSDLTLFSQFNEGLLFTGLTGAARCNAKGRPDDKGEYFRGVELRMVGSVHDNYHSISIMPDGSGFTVGYGPHPNGHAEGNTVNSGDAFTLIQLAQMLAKDFEKAGLTARLVDSKGDQVALEAKTVRRAAKKGEDLGLEPTMTLCCGAKAADMAEAFNTACAMCRVMYERFGLETEVFNLGCQFGNFTLARNEDFEVFWDKVAQSGKKGLVFLTATLVCRRCRREVDGFAIMAERYPDVQFALVNMNAPHAKFHERVFGDLAGGDPDQFVQVAKGVTPFTIVYTADGKGGLQYREYFATGKTEAPPTPEFACSVLDRHFS